MSWRGRLLVVLLLGACAPTATDVRSDPVTVAAPFGEVFTAVVEFVTEDPGIPPYNPGGVNGYRRGPSTPWLVTTSDREAGLIVAEARSRAAGFVGSDAEPDVHQVNILVRDSGGDVLNGEGPRTQVSVRGTPFTRVFVNRLQLMLESRFGG